MLSSIQKYGKILAIKTSAILFGVMHPSIPQSVLAALVGILSLMGFQNGRLEWLGSGETFARFGK